MAQELVTEYGKIVDAKLRASLVTKDNFILNTFYEGLPTAGAVKIPVRDDECTAGDYSTTSLGTNAINYGNTHYITAVLDKDKFVNEYIDGYEAEAVPDNIVADRLDSAGYSLALSEDQDALKTLVNGADGKDRAGVAFAEGDVRHEKTGAVSGVALSKTNIYETIVGLMVALDEAKVPAEGRYLIVTPAVYALILQDDHFIRQSQLSQEMLMSGACGMIAGFAIYKSNYLGTLKANTNKDVQILAGHPLFATRVEAWKKEPYLQDLSGDMNVVGGSAVKGRMVFTHEVTKPQAFALVTKNA